MKSVHFGSSIPSNRYNGSGKNPESDVVNQGCIHINTIANQTKDIDRDNDSKCTTLNTHKTAAPSLRTSYLHDLTSHHRARDCL